MTATGMAFGAGRRVGRRKAVSRLMLALTIVATGLAIVPLIWILAYVVIQALPALSPSFLTDLPTPVGVPGGGIGNSIVGSAITVGLGVLMAAPVGLLAALFLALSPNRRLATAIRFGTDVVAGVPSIVMGMFVYAIVVLPQRHFSALSGAVVLGLIMLPIIIRTAEEMLRLVPASLREGSLALGAAEWRTAAAVLVPAAVNGIITGVMLAVARAAGEAAPMLFTAFGNPFMSTDLNQPIATLPHTVFLYANSPYEDWRAKAWATALVLIVLVLGLNVIARLIASSRARRLGALGA
jgi:phosphate transport system permease protein